MPMTFLVAFTSASPSALPCALPVFWASGAGQAITVRSEMNEGRSVTARALSKAVARACTFSSYVPSSASQSTSCTCQP